MRRLYEEYLHVPEEGKIREKVLISRVVVAVIGILVWMSAMGFTAYAYFTSSITSGSNTITAATYGVEIEVVPNGGTAIEPNTENLLLYENVGAGTYAMSLKATGTATTGYCKIEIVGNEKTVTLYTQQMAPKEYMSFTLVLNGGANITVTPQWGTYSNRDVVVGDKSTQEIQLVTEVDKNVTTPSTPGVSQIPNANEEITAGSQPENQTNRNDSPDNQDVDETTPGSVSDETSNGKNNDDNSETVQDGNVIE